ncbi:MAG: hypothetical protein IJS53_02750 [Clostridia bacterium]|nr:hypothetical protein [Clostridia bacterium]
MSLLEAIENSRKLVLELLAVLPVRGPEAGGVIAGFTKEADIPMQPHWPHPFFLMAGDNRHYPMGKTYLRYGFRGVAERAEKNALAPDKTPEARANLLAARDEYNALAGFAARHADAVDDPALKADYLQLASGAPLTFRQAVQAFYLLWRVRSVGCTGSIGRLDQHLYPFYRADMEAGRLTEDEALSILCELWEKLNAVASGDTLVTLMLGGSGPDGADETNDLSCLMLRASLAVRKTEPHVSVRLHEKTRADFRALVSQVHLLGHGQAAVYYDANILPVLIAHGVPAEYACRYCTNGCTEVVLDGAGKIEFDPMDAVKTVELTLNRGAEPALPGDTVGYYWTRNVPPVEQKSTCDPGFDSGDWTASKEALRAAFDRQLVHQFRYHIDRLMRRRSDMRAFGLAHALLNASFDTLLESGGDAVRGDLPCDVWMLFAGSLPTAADALTALNRAVFEEKRYTSQEIMNALAANFEGCEEMRARLRGLPKFGNDNDEADAEAARLCALFCDTLEACSRENGVLIWPALIGYLFVQEALFTGATPDGRRWKDPIGEHFSPTPGCAVNGPTALMLSAAKAPLKRAFGVAPVHISLPRSAASDREKSLETLAQLVDAGEKLGFNMLDISIYDAEEMREAQKDPENHADLIVRVWGYSARFIDLSDEMQEHVIARILA